MRLISTTVALAVSMTFAIAALADSRLPADQQTKVEAMLKQEGFSTWKKVEMDDGMIEVDDAVDASGKIFDLKLDPTSMKITKRDPE